MSPHASVCSYQGLRRAGRDKLTSGKLFAKMAKTAVALMMEHSSYTSGVIVDVGETHICDSCFGYVVIDHGSMIIPQQ